MSKFHKIRDWDSEETYVREVTPGRFHFNRIEHTEDWGEVPPEYGKYYGTLCEVDLTLMPREQQLGAYKCCGLDEYGSLGTIEPEILAEACLDYGAYAVLYQETDNNKGKLLREHSKWSYHLERNPSAWEGRLDQPGNALGSTKREMMCGDIMSAIARGCEKGDKNAELMAKLQGMEIVEPITQFGTLDSTGQLILTKTLKQSSMKACPHCIIDPAHYRDDETCKCDDRDETIMLRWGYRWSEEKKQWV